MGELTNTEARQNAPRVATTCGRPCSPGGVVASDAWGHGEATSQARREGGCCRREALRQQPGVMPSDRSVLAERGGGRAVSR